MSPLRLFLQPATTELSALRHSLRTFLADVDEPADDWLLIATELVTNAIAAAPAESEIEVELKVRPERLELRVADMGGGFVLQPKTSVSPGSKRGRGLMLVNALTDDFTVSTEEGRTIATASKQRTDGGPTPMEATADGRPLRRAEVAVIGLGSAGEAVAQELAKAGRTVVGFEKHRVGGECPFVACMPSKSLLVDAHAARTHDDPRSAWPAAIERREQIVSDRDDSEHMQGLLDVGVEVVRATARLIGERQLEADGTVWQADHVVLATGSSPVFPDIAGLDRARAWSPFDALSASTRPERVGIIGAGAVGCELADVYRSFGSEVTLLDHSDRLLADHDAAVADRFEEGLRSLGIDLQLSVEVKSIQHGDDADEITHIGPHGRTSTVVDQIIVASGQAPRLPDLGLESIGVDLDELPELDEHRRLAGMSWLSMIGDLNGEDPWTHGANRDAAIVAGAILGSPWATTTSAMPRATFTQPAASHVGKAATEENTLIRGVGALSDIARSSTDELDDGIVVVAVDPSTGLVVGCSAVGPLADELIAMATSLVHFEIPIERARTQVFAFPTISQVLEVAIADAAAQFIERTSV